MPQNKEKHPLLVLLQTKVFNARFFTISLLVHVILVFLLGGTVLYHHMAEHPDFTGDSESGNSDSAAAPPVDKPMENQPTMTVPTEQQNAVETITTLNATATPTFTMPEIATPVLPTTPTEIEKTVAPSVPSSTAGALTATQNREIGAFTSGWAGKKGSSGVGSSPKNREFQFTAYLAKYRGGDWASCNWISTDAAGKEVIHGGSLSNLLYLMNKLSRDKIHAEPEGIPLDLASQEIFVKKPPFIFFTGHQDFVLTPQELENLQKYIRMGGCIWGDSSLPGRNSRFDIAFRREMRRVIPDADKNWEVLPPNHALYTKNLYYPEIKQPPPGVNCYQEPVYALKYAGEVAVIYTANDYGDMWQIGLTDKLVVDYSQDAKHQYLAINLGIWRFRDIYYGGIDEKSVLNSYKFGTNVVIHLLTRWEDRLKMAPTGL